MAPSPSSPVGIVLSAKKGYTVGPKLGAGAQCAVHAILCHGEPTPFVTKCAPLPLRPKNPKAKPSLAEINANSINKEYMLYNIHFPSLHGNMIPTLGFQQSATANPKIEKDGT
jgi:hypothetical protein